MSDLNVRTLSQVVGYIKKLVDDNLAGKSFWLKTEVSHINFHRSGHAYLDLVESKDGKTLAQCRASIWNSNLQHIRMDLGDDLNNILKPGAEILCKAEVNFDQVFGLSINIFEVDKSFVLGELERKKQETIKRLVEEELIGLNKRYILPVVIQHIAIIGSPGTSGHTDFLKQLASNDYKYKFIVKEFPCQVQGIQAEAEIISRLKELNDSRFDVIVLIRGGGSKLDLEVFNSFELAKSIASHSKPILTGIGHETDISVADLVANREFKTPSALGAFIVERAHNFDVKVSTDFLHIKRLYQQFLESQKFRTKNNSDQLHAKAISYTQLKRGQLHAIGNRINTEVRYLLADQHENHKIAKQVITTVTVNNIKLKLSRLKEIQNIFEINSLQILKQKTAQLNHSKELILLSIKDRSRRENDFLQRADNLILVYHPQKTLQRGYSISRRPKINENIS